VFQPILVFNLAGTSMHCSRGSDTGTLRLALTDAPACGFDTVFITIEKVRVHKSGSAMEQILAGWEEFAPAALPMPVR